MTVKIYYSDECQPCRDMKSRLFAMAKEQGMEIVNIDTDEGFEQFARDSLDKGDGTIPSVYNDGRKCNLDVDYDTKKITVQCPVRSSSS